MSRIGLFLLFSALVACHSSEDDTLFPYLRYWDNWGDYSSPLEIESDMTPEEWSKKIVKYLRVRGVQVQGVKTGFQKIEVWGCPVGVRTGDYIDVLVPLDQRVVLKKLGFQEE